MGYRRPVRAAEDGARLCADICQWRPRNHRLIAPTGLFSKVTLSLKDIEQQQKHRIQTLTAGASQASDAIVNIVARTGIRVVDDEPQATAAARWKTKRPIGGPFVEPGNGRVFDNSLVALDMALARLEHVRSQARKLPFNNPSPASDITSRFGNRLDPFLGRLALHAGIDFRAPSGTRIRCDGTRNRHRCRQERRLRQHGRDRPRQRHHDALRPSIVHSGQWSATRFRQAKPLAAPAAPAARRVRICIMRSA